MSKPHPNRWLLTGATALAVIFGTMSLLPAPALAQGGNAQQGQGGPGGNDNAGQGGQGQGGQGGPPANAGEAEDSDGRGPKYGQPGEDDQRGGKPVWAQEGIPEVELGRLSVIRSPDQVLDRALAEVIANFDAETMAVYYEMTALEFVYVVETNWDGITIIDSPLENLALLTELWTTGDVSLPGVDVPEGTNMIELAAIFIGVASDKNLPISEDTVTALATIVGVSLPDSVLASIADKAEDVRVAVLAAHG